MSPSDPREQQAILLGNQVATQMFFRFGQRVPLDELRSLALPAAVAAAALWDGRGSLPRFVVQRTRWAVLDALRTQQRQNKRLDGGALQQMAAVQAERAGELTAHADQTAVDPLPPAAALGSFFAGAAAGFTLELDAAGALEVPDPDEDVEENAQRMRLRRAVEALPEAERAVLEQHSYRGATFKEIAEAGGLEDSTVFSRYARAVDRLRQTFEDVP